MRRPSAPRRRAARLLAVALAASGARAGVEADLGPAREGLAVLVPALQGATLLRVVGVVLRDLLPAPAETRLDDLLDAALAPDAGAGSGPRADLVGDPELDDFGADDLALLGS